MNVIGTQNIDEIFSVEMQIGHLDLSRGDASKLNNLDNWLIQSEKASMFEKFLINKQYEQKIFNNLNRKGK